MEVQHITIEDYKPLGNAYAQAVENDQEQFEYKGGKFLTSYARYLLEHLGNLLHENRT